MWAVKKLLLTGFPVSAVCSLILPAVMSGKLEHSSIPWWHHQMDTFSELLALCAGNSPVTGEFPAQRSVTQSFDVFFDLRLNKWLSRQLGGWWFDTPLCSLWHHCIDARKDGAQLSTILEPWISLTSLVIVKPYRLTTCQFGIDVNLKNYSEKCIVFDMCQLIV